MQGNHVGSQMRSRAMPGVDNARKFELGGRASLSNPILDGILAKILCLNNRRACRPEQTP